MPQNVYSLTVDYLAIGISSIKRINGMQYLLGTIQSLADKTSTKEKLELVVIVFLADFDQSYNNDVIKVGLICLKSCVFASGHLPGGG